MTLIGPTQPSRWNRGWRGAQNAHSLSATPTTIWVYLDLFAFSLCTFLGGAFNFVTPYEQGVNSIQSVWQPVLASSLEEGVESAAPCLPTQSKLWSFFAINHLLSQDVSFFKCRTSHRGWKTLRSDPRGSSYFVVTEFNRVSILVENERSPLDAIRHKSDAI